MFCICMSPYYWAQEKFGSNQSLRRIKPFVVSGFNRFRVSVMTSFAPEYARSEGEPVAGITRKSFAIFERLGDTDSFD